MIKNIKEIRECQECGSSNIFYDKKKNQVLCRDCGCIFEPLTEKEEDKFEQIRKK